MSAPIESTDPTVDTVVEDPNTPEGEQGHDEELPKWARDKLAKANREAHNLRNRLRDIEPLAQEAVDAREAQKTEIQRATEQAQSLAEQLAEQQLLNERLGLANRYAIPESHHRYIVGGSPEEREDAARGISEMLKAATAPTVTPPPTDRPVATLHPGASPMPQDTSPSTVYPAHWIPKRPPPRKG